MPRVCRQACLRTKRICDLVRSSDDTPRRLHRTPRNRIKARVVAQAGTIKANKCSASA